MNTSVREQQAILSRGYDESNEPFPLVLRNVMESENKLQLGYDHLTSISPSKITAFIKNQTEPTLNDLQKIIVQLNLCEKNANRLTAAAGYQHIGAYLMLAHLFGLKPEIVPTHKLKDLLIRLIHSEVLGVDIWKVPDLLPANRPHLLTDNQFDRLKNFIVRKILPLVRERKYPSIAKTLVNDIILSYPALDNRDKELLSLLVSVAEETTNYLHSPDHMINRVMGRRESEKKAIDKSVGKVITELRQNPRVEQPTVYEKFLIDFKARNYDPIDVAELGEAHYNNSPDAERAVQFKISKLNKRLSPFGIQIERRTTYTLKRVGEKKYKP